MLKDKILDIYYNFRNGIPNIIKWFPVIWDDRNWDYCYFFIIIKFKLKLMEKSMRMSDFHSKPYSKQIKDCVEILERLINEDYEEKAFKEHDKKYGKLNMKFIPHIKKDGTESKDLKSVIFKRENVKTEEDKKEERKSSRECYRRSREKHLDDLHTLFNSIKSNVLYWWN